MNLEIKPLHVRLIVPGAGAIGFYLGAFLGAYLAVRWEKTGFLELLLAYAFGAAAALPSLLAAERALAPASKDVDTLLVLKHLCAATAVVAVERGIAEAWLPVALPVFFEHLLIWGAGMAAVRSSEPDFVSWRTELESLTSRPRS